MEKQKLATKVRWYLRYKDPKFGWVTLMYKDAKRGVRYFDSFSELSKCVAERVDANPAMQFQFVKDTYWVLAW